MEQIIYNQKWKDKLTENRPELKTESRNYQNLPIIGSV